MHTNKYIRNIGVLWALLGISILLSFAIYRLFSNFQDIHSVPLGNIEQIALVAWTSIMLYAEGYRGFQKRFSPRFAARALHIQKNGTFKDALLAPLLCMGFFRATSKQITRTWVLTACIVLFVILAGTAPSPWRSIISGGVMIGLFYGLSTVWISTVSTIRNGTPLTDKEVV